MEFSVMEHSGDRSSVSPPGAVENRAGAGFSSRDRKWPLKPAVGVKRGWR